MSQKIVRGVSPLFSLLENKKTLLVCGNSFDSLDFSVDILKYDVVRFSSFSPNPKYEDVCKGVEIFNSQNCEQILAVGGGSAIDTAKCIKLFSKMSKEELFLNQEFKDSQIPLLAIPTTAGTGSESTQHAVIYYKGEKQSISHLSLVPDAAFLEPETLKNLPLYQKKCTLLDALCQSLESYWSVKSTEQSRENCLLALGLIEENWKEYINDNTKESREKIMLASNFAGKAINVTATTAPHAMSYKLTSFYKLPHGHSVALCLAEVWEFMLKNLDKCADARGCDYLKGIFDSIPVSPEWFRNLLSELEMQYPSSKNKSEDIEHFVSAVNPNRMKNNPVSLTQDDFKNMYDKIIK